MKTQTAPSSNILFNYVFTPSNATVAVNTFLAFQTYGANSAPPALGIHVELDNGYFAVSGVYYGTKTQFTAAIKPFLDAVPKAPSSSSVKTYDWPGILQQLAGSDGSLNTSTKADVSDTFYAKSLMVAQDKPLTTAALTSFFAYLYGPGKTSDTSWFILVSNIPSVVQLVQSSYFDLFQRRTYGVVPTRLSMLFPVLKRRSLVALRYTLSSSMRLARTRLPHIQLMV